MTTDTHEFVADWYRPSSCVNCGQKRDHSIHTVEEVMTTDTHESDEQFVKRMRDRVISFGGFRYALPMSNREDLDRLLSLALRGAAVRWRPISEAPPYRHVSVWVPPDSGKKGHIRHNALWCADEGKWTDENFDTLEVTPTHFIPLTALGEPTND